MSGHHPGSAFSLLRQGLTLGYDFGVHSLEALLWVAETVEESVYLPKSLVRTPLGLSFVLANPPLRLGAFSSLRVWLDGDELRPEETRLRAGPARPWRTTADVTESNPLELRPGEPTEFALDRVPVEEGRTVTVRLELQSVAIPPLVWFEFSEVPRTEAPA